MERTYFNQVITSQTSNGYAQVSKVYNKDFIEPNKNKKVTVCVDKFKMSLTSIPLLIFNQTANYYSFELIWDVFTSGRISLFPFYYSTFPIGSPYFYYVFQQSHFIDIMNQALAGAFAVVSLSVGFPVGQQAPFFYADPDTHILKLYTTAGYLEGAGANRINILCNTTMAYEYLDGFPKFALNPNVLVPLANGQDARLFVINKIVNTETIGVVVYTIQATDSKEDTIIKWNMCKGVVITSSLKTKTEPFPTGELGLTYGNLHSADILMNFDILYNNNGKPIILNYASFNHDKKINIMNTQDTRNITLKFYWYDKNNQLYDLFIYRDDICSIRLVFDELNKF